MGLFSKLFEKRNLSVTDPKAWNPGLWNLYGAQTTSGATVNEENALTSAAVYNAISLISGTVGSLPLHLMQRRGPGTSIETNRQLYYLLHSACNAEMTAMALRETMTAHLLAWGNCFAEKVYDGEGNIIALWPIPPNKVRIDRKNGELIYYVTVNSEEIPLRRDRMLHIPGLGFDGLQGYSVITLARESIGLGMAMEEFGARWFGNGTHPGVIVSHPGRLGQEAHDNLKGDLTSKYSGLGKSHRLLLLEEGMKIEDVGVPPEDSQFLQSRQFQITDIARWFNLPPHKLKDLSKSSFSNIEQEQISFVQDTMLPLLQRIEQNYNLQLLTDAERKQHLYFKHNVEGLLRGDSESRGKFYNQMWMIGTMSINEIRAREDLNPIYGGDEYFVPLNMVPLSMAGQQPEPVIEDEPEADDELDQERQTRSVGGRNALQNTYKSQFINVTKRILDLEVADIRAALNKYLTKRSRADFDKWLDSYYETHSQDVIRDMLPPLMRYANAIQGEANREVKNTPEMTPELKEFTRQYAETFGLRYSGSSRGQLKAILEGVPADEVRDAIETRISEWEETRPEKVAKNETVRANNAIARAVFISAGIVKLRWVAQGNKSCVYCQELNGKVVGVENPFVDEGPYEPKGASGKMKIRGPHFAPPLHQGCVCAVVPSI
jgi:HK97 family phage portal protein